MRERSTHTPVSEDRDKRTKCFVSSENPKILLISLNPSFGFQCTLVAIVGRAIRTNVVILCRRAWTCRVVVVW